MRVTASYSLNDQYLPLDYRSGFAALLKESLKDVNEYLFMRYYAKPHVLKPFTFSVYFPELAGGEGDRLNVGTKAVLHFSTSSHELGASIYNGLRQRDSFPLFENRLQLSHIHLQPLIAIRQESAIFKSMAPILVNNKGNADWYLLPGDDGFEEGLSFAVNEIIRSFLGGVDARVKFNPIRIHRKVVRHYNMNMQGFTGIFELRGRSDVLNLIYQVGLGVRRSQGFGMLELVKQGSISEPIAG
ncbi:MAG: CRISPR-associated endoribonuclease Cas6 [Candidatus Bipolaricaulota bacterium]|nr:CRISPR-associated endoribonuclease Cas6 [Candidatus Bipolaricaulota bacterium]